MPAGPSNTTPAPGSPTPPAEGTPPGETGAGTTSDPPPARVQVTAKEFNFTLSRPEVTAGKVIIELVNGGQDEHNLHIRPAAGGPDVGAFPTTQAGQHLDETFELGPGTYTFYCSMPAHESLGMKSTFTVR